MTDRAALRTNAAASYLGISRNSLLRHGPKPVRIGGCVVYPVAMLDAWLQAKTSTARKADTDAATESAVNAIRQDRKAKARRRKR